MKRFITEYANYRLTQIQKDAALTEQAKIDLARRIDRAACLCNRELISVDECMRIIAETSGNA